MKQFYISGKISGNPNYEFEFDCAHRRMQHSFPTHLIVDPTEICDPSWSWIRCMSVCIRALLRCDAIVLIDGWQSSRGARIERLIAKMLRLNFYTIIVSSDGRTRLFPYEI